MSEKDEGVCMQEHTIGGVWMSRASASASEFVAIR